MPFIVAMKMKGHLVGKSIVCVVSVQVIDLNMVSVSKGQFAPSTFPLLLVQQLAKRGSCQWVVL